MSDNSPISSYLRIFPTLSTDKILTQEGDKKVILSNQRVSRSVNFEFDQVFNQNMTNLDIYRFVHDQAINKLFDNTNCCILCLGQKNAGKSFTLFGRDQFLNVDALVGEGSKSFKSRNKGIVYKVFDSLEKSGTNLQDKEFQIICNFLEVHNENVRDLMVGFSLDNDSDTSMEEGGVMYEAVNTITKKDIDGLEVQETSNGQINIKNMTGISIISEEDLSSLIEYGMQRRVALHQYLSQNSRNSRNIKPEKLIQNSHTILNINFILRDRENYNFPSLNATVQFVEVACPEKISEELNDQERFQSSLCINSQLFTLQKVLYGIHKNLKQLPYKDSKLTKVIQNNCNINSEVITINHIIPTQNSFADCLKVLNQSKKFTNPEQEFSIVDEVGKTTINEQKNGDVVSSMLTNEEEQIVKKLREDIDHKTRRIEDTRKLFLQQLSDIGHIIGATEDIQELVNKPNAKFWTSFIQKKEVLGKIKAMEAQIKQQERSKIYNEKQIQAQHEEITSKKEVQASRKFELEDEIAYLKDQIQIVENRSEKLEKQILEKKSEDTSKLAMVNKRLLDEKSKKFQNFPQKYLHLKDVIHLTF